MEVKKFIEKIKNENVVVDLNEGLAKPHKEMLSLLQELCETNNTIAVKKDRQVGMSTLLLFFIAYKLLFDENNINIAYIVTKLPNGRVIRRDFDGLFERIVKIFNLEKDVNYVINNREQIIIQINGHVKILTIISQHGLFDNLRGMHYDYVLCDEVDYWNLSDSHINMPILEEKEDNNNDLNNVTRRNKKLLEAFKLSTDNIIFYGFHTILEYLQGGFKEDNYTDNFMIWLLNSNYVDKKYYFFNYPLGWVKLD